MDNRLAYRKLNTVTEEELQHLMKIVDGEVEFKSIERGDDCVSFTYPVTLGDDEESFVVNETIELYPDEIVFPWVNYIGQVSTDFLYEQWLVAYGFSPLLKDNPFIKVKEEES